MPRGKKRSEYVSPRWSKHDKRALRLHGAHRKNAGLPGVRVPAALERRLRGVPAHRVAEEGMAACAEIVAALRELPGLAGVHVMAVAYEQGVPEILTAAGLGRAA